MIIAFEKVGTLNTPISLESKGIRLEGLLKRRSSHEVQLEAKLFGDLDLNCDRCGTAYLLPVDSSLCLKLFNQLAGESADLETIEFLDGKIDLAYLIESELNAIRGEYHYCSGCDSSDEFEVEY
jgi:uncharacterized metal-binding protein YceD (DUF177 family)